MGSYLGGVHLEMTGEDVTECGLLSDEIPSEYKTYCDPRLNYNQAIEVVLKMCDLFKQ